MFGLIQRYFISGLLVWLPIWVTLLVMNFLINLLSKSLLLLPHEYQPDVLLGYHIPGIGVILTVLVIFLTGLLAANFIGSKLVSLGDAIMARIPLVRTIYTGVKQVTQTLFTPGGQSFRKVLLVEYPCRGVWSVAFQTGEVNREIEGVLNGDPMVSYFIPTTPNPTSGFFLMMPTKDVIELDMTVDEALKYIISMGVVAPPSRPRTIPKT